MDFMHYIKILSIEKISFFFVVCACEEMRVLVHMCTRARVCGGVRVLVRVLVLACIGV